MRTIDALLTTAQQAAARTPHVKVVLTSRSRAASTTYITTDATQRLVFVQQAESRFDDQSGVVSALNPIFPVSAVIRLRNGDQALNSIDFRGRRCEITWGYVTSPQKDAGNSPPTFIVEQRNISIQGQLYVELYGSSLWDLLEAAWQLQTTTVQIKYDKNVAIQYILMELLGGRAVSNLPVTGGSTDYPEDIVGYTGSYANLRAKALSPSAGNSDVTEDVTFFQATPAASDKMYFGLDDLFEHITINLSTAGSGLTLVWEYWSGVAWTTLTVIDNTSNFTAAGIKTISWTAPTDWATANFRNTNPGDGTSTEFSNKALYYVRVRVSSVSAPTQPKARKVMLHQDFALAFDTTGLGEDYSPEYTSDLGQSAKSIVKHILDRTLIGIKVQDDGFHVVKADNSITPIDYTYGTDHALFAGTLRESLIIPNKITYSDRQPGAAGTSVEGTDSNSTSITALGTVPEIVIDTGITSGSVATTLAQRAIKRILRDATQGEILAPMSCNQEVWDVVSAVDSRSGKTYTGRVSSLVRTFDPLHGVYEIAIAFGGLTVSYNTLLEIMAAESEPYSPAMAGTAFMQPAHTAFRLQTGHEPTSRRSISSGGGAAWMPGRLYNTGAVSRPADIVDHEGVLQVSRFLGSWGIAYSVSAGYDLAAISTALTTATVATSVA